MIKSLIGAVAAFTVTMLPVAAAAAPANPAASLSVAKSVRASTPTSAQSKLGGSGALYAALVVAGVIAILVIGTNRDNKAKSP